MVVTVQHPKPTILIVEDEEGPRNALKIILRPFFELAITSNRQEALQALLAQPIDLVTLDLKLPDGYGLDLFHAQLGELYATTGQKDLALEELATNKKLNPYHLNFFKSRAKIYLTLGQNEPASLELEAARKLAPTDPKLAYNLGLVYTRLDRVDLAEKELKDAITLKPNYAEPYYALTLLYEGSNQVAKVTPLLTVGRANLATYSAQLKEKIEKYTKD